MTMTPEKLNDLVADALAKVSDLGTVGAMKWLANHALAERAMETQGQAHCLACAGHGASLDGSRDCAKCGGSGSTDATMLMNCKACDGTGSRPQGQALPELPKPFHTVYDDIDHEEVPCYSPTQMHAYARAYASQLALPAGPVPELEVWYGSMPESNGKSNFTATLRRKGASLFDTNSYTFARSEYPERVRYEADCMRFLIGEIDKEPFILDYDADKHSGYVEPPSPAVAQLVPEGAAITATGGIYYNIAELKHQAEEAECVSMCLDDRGVPKADAEGKTFSLWGRVVRFAQGEKQ